MEPQAGQGPVGGQVRQDPMGQPGAEIPAGGQPRTPSAARGGLAPTSVEEIVQTEVVTAERDTPIATVVAEMAEKDVGSVVIVEEDSPVGIVTDRQIALALETTPDVAERDVEELLSDDLVTGSTDMSVPEVLERLSDAGIRRLPIVDEEDALVGIVTVDDVLVLFSEEFGSVADIVRTQSPRL